MLTDHCLNKLMSDLRERLASDPGLSDDVSFGCTFFSKQGGLAGDVEIHKRLSPPKSVSETRPA